jgi:hypothetical protein
MAVERRTKEIVYAASTVTLALGLIRVLASSEIQPTNNQVAEASNPKETPTMVDNTPLGLPKGGKLTIVQEGYCPPSPNAEWTYLPNKVKNEEILYDGSYYRCTEIVKSNGVTVTQHEWYDYPKTEDNK